MDIKNFYCLITLFFGQIICGNNDYRLVDIINETNLPIIVKQLDYEVAFCGAFSTKPAKARIVVELCCLVSKRKHRDQCEPIKLILSSYTTSFKFFRENNYIIVNPIESDYSSEELV